MSDHRRLTIAEDGSRLAKSDPRVSAAAFCEDAAAGIGLAIALGGQLAGVQTQLLGGIQNDLIDLVSDLKNPTSGSAGAGLRVDDGYVERVRYLSDHYGQQLDEPDGTVIPGGTAMAALIHKARTSVRLAEAHAWQAAENNTASINQTAADYLDELDHLLLQLARLANVEHGDLIWQPGLSAREAAQADTTEHETVHATDDSEAAQR